MLAALGSSSAFLACLSSSRPLLAFLRFRTSPAFDSDDLDGLSGSSVCVRWNVPLLGISGVPSLAWARVGDSQVPPLAPV